MYIIEYIHVLCFHVISCLCYTHTCLRSALKTSPDTGDPYSRPAWWCQGGRSALPGWVLYYGGYPKHPMAPWRVWLPMDPNTSWEATANPPVITPQSQFLRRYGWIHNLDDYGEAPWIGHLQMWGYFWDITFMGPTGWVLLLLSLSFFVWRLTMENGI